MTRGDHPTGTDRLAEVAESLSEEIVVNIQGDEPLIQGNIIDAAIDALLADPEAPMPRAFLVNLLSRRPGSKAPRIESTATYPNAAVKPEAMRIAPAMVPCARSQEIMSRVYRRSGSGEAAESANNQPTACLR